MSKYIKKGYRKPQDLTGKRFRMFSVINRDLESKKKEVRWIVKCDCGKIISIRSSSLTSGKSISCGCYAKEMNTKKHRTHGMSKTRTYRAWQNMIDRCDNANSKSYNNYGKRGITASHEWHNFNTFYKDMGDKPKGLSLERKNNDMGYCKENCKWATPKEQMMNTRYNKILTLNGISLNISAWSEKLGINRSTLYNRSRRNWTDARTLTFPVISKKMKGI